MSWLSDALRGAVVKRALVAAWRAAVAALLAALVASGGLQPAEPVAPVVVDPLPSG